MAHRDEPANQNDTAAAYGNAIAPALGLVVIIVLACTAWSLGLSRSRPEPSLSRCAAITADEARLACFDKLAEPRAPARGALAVLPHRRDETSQ